MRPLCGHLVLGIHISPNNGLIEMIPSAKLIVGVSAVYWTLWIMQIGPVLVTV